MKSLGVCVVFNCSHSRYTLVQSYKTVTNYVHKPLVRFYKVNQKHFNVQYVQEKPTAERSEHLTLTLVAILITGSFRIATTINVSSSLHMHSCTP